MTLPLRRLGSSLQELFGVASPGGGVRSIASRSRASSHSSKSMPLPRFVPDGSVAGSSSDPAAPFGKTAQPGKRVTVLVEPKPLAFGYA